MKILLAAMPERNLTVMGFEGDHQIGEAKYFNRGTLRMHDPNGETQVEMAIHVENGDQDPSVSTTASQATRGAGRGE